MASDSNGEDLRHVKLRVDLTDLVRDGWPPSTAEWLWATDHGNGLFRIDNVPVFAKGVSNGDLVRANKVDDHWEFERREQRGGHSTYRVILLHGRSVDDPPSAAWWERLQEAGCTFEGYQGGPLYAIDVPPESFSAAIDVFKDGEANAIWEYEEGDVATL